MWSFLYIVFEKHRNDKIAFYLSKENDNKILIGVQNQTTSNLKFTEKEKEHILWILNTSNYIITW